MNTRLDRTNPEMIMDHLSPDRQIALKSWLKRYNHNEWMQGQDGWRCRASLIASCDQPRSIFDWSRILYCARRGLFCGLPDFCDRCCLDKRVQPALDEYGECFDAAGPWYPMVVNTRIRPDEAGVEFQDSFKLSPFTGKPDGMPLSTGPEHESNVECLCRALFALPALLKDRGIIAGAISRIEFHLSVWPGESNYDRWSGLTHAVQPHVNILCNTAVPMTPKLAQAIYDTLGLLPE